MSGRQLRRSAQYGRVVSMSPFETDVVDREVPDWALVLDELYEGEYSKLDFTDDVHDSEVTTYSSIAEEIPMDRGEVKEAVAFMVRAGLIHDSSPGPNIGKTVLTPKGFEVAHERRLLEYREARESQRISHQEANEDRRFKRQNKMNATVGFLTFGLLTVTFFDTLISSVGGGHEIVLLVMEGVIVLGISISIYNSGVFNLADEERS